jgi:hypothetical protein
MAFLVVEFTHSIQHSVIHLSSYNRCHDYGHDILSSPSYHYCYYILRFHTSVYLHVVVQCMPIKKFKVSDLPKFSEYTLLIHTDFIIVVVVVVVVVIIIIIIIYQFIYFPDQDTFYEGQVKEIIPIYFNKLWVLFSRFNCNIITVYFNHLFYTSTAMDSDAEFPLEPPSP